MNARDFRISRPLPPALPPAAVRPPRGVEAKGGAADARIRVPFSRKRPAAVRADAGLFGRPVSAPRRPAGAEPRGEPVALAVPLPVRVSVSHEKALRPLRPFRDAPPHRRGAARRLEPFSRAPERKDERNAPFAGAEPARRAAENNLEGVLRELAATLEGVAGLRGVLERMARRRGR